MRISIGIDDLEVIRRRLEASGGDECTRASEAIKGFLAEHSAGFTEDQACKLLYAVWGLVSKALDIESHDSGAEGDLTRLESRLADTIAEYRLSGGSVFP